LILSSKILSKNFNLLLICTFFSNLFFRLYNINTSPFTYDEIISVKDTLLDFGHLKHESEWEPNPPFYYYCLWIWSKIFGITEIGIRSFSAFTTSLMITVLAFFLSKNVSKISAIGFILISSFSFPIYYYSQEARAYSLVLLLFGLNLIIYYKFITQENKLHILLLGLFNFLLLYTHYMTFYVMIFQFITIILFIRKKIQPYLLSALVLLTFILLRFTKKQLLIIFQVGTDSTSDKWINYANISDLSSFFNNMYFNWYLFAIVIAIIIYFQYGNYVNKKLDPFIFYMFILGFATPIVHFLIGRKIPVFIDRYLLFSVLAVFTLISFNLKNNLISYVLIATIAVFNFSKIKFIDQKGVDFRSAAKFIKENQKNSIVIIQPKSIMILFTYYYDIEIFKAFNINGISILESNQIFQATDINDLQSINLIDNRTIIVLESFSKQDRTSATQKYFNSLGYCFKKYTIFTGVESTIYKKQL